MLETEFIIWKAERDALKRSTLRPWIRAYLVITGFAVLLLVLQKLRIVGGILAEIWVPVFIAAIGMGSYFLGVALYRRKLVILSLSAEVADSDDAAM